MNFTQGQSSIGVYFTKLKTIWEELSNHRPVCFCGKCECGGIKKSVDHYHMEYVMSFFYGIERFICLSYKEILLYIRLDPNQSVVSSHTNHAMVN